MRVPLVCLLLVLSACGRGTVSLEGSLSDTTQAIGVLAQGEDSVVAIQGGAFRLRAVPADSAQLTFTSADGDVAQMLLGGLRSGGTVTLARIWIADGLAFPAEVRGNGDAPLLVNGLRMAPPEAVPADVNVQATVLAVSDDGDALLVRPVEASLPDLSIAITPRSVVRTIDGDPMAPDRLEFGDSLRVSGVGQGGYVIASEIMVPRRVAAEEGDRSSADDADDESEPAGEPAPAPARTVLAPRPEDVPRSVSGEQTIQRVAERARERNEDDIRKEAERAREALERAAEQARERAQKRDEERRKPEEERGKGKGGGGRDGG